MEVDTLANNIHIILDELQLFMAFSCSNALQNSNDINHIVQNKNLIYEIEDQFLMGIPNIILRIL